MSSTYTPLQLTVLAGLLQNLGFAVNANLTAAINSYETNSVIAPLLNTISVGSTGNILNSSNLTAIKTLGSTSCPALGDSVPAAFSIPTSNSQPGLSGVETTTANKYLGNGDLTKYVQAFYAAQAYAQQTNIVINSAVNSQTYLGGTFTNTNNMITGGITGVTTDVPAFASDLLKLGTLINLSDLGNWGSPFGLLQQIIKTTGHLPSLSALLVANGVSEQVVIQLDDPKASVTDTVQKQIYATMEQVTGSALTEILTVLRITTPNIETLADLLNPYKIFPNSYQSLIVPTANGYVNIYSSNQGTVNTDVAALLPSYVRSSLV